MGLQLRSCSRRQLHHLLGDCVDLDIHNCQFTLLAQLVDKMELQGEYFTKLFEPIRNCAERRGEMREP